MLRTTMILGGSIANNSIGVFTAVPKPVCVQCVRWRRKPRWLPVAKSKLFRIPEKPKIPEDESIELKRLHNQYKTAVKSLRRHIRDTILGNTVVENTQLREAEEKEDFARCEELNNKWNESIAEIRKERLAKQRELRKEEILQKLLDKEKRDLIILEQVNEQVKRVKEEGLTFITEKNIDQAIEDALNNPVDHNWALDENGTVHRGKYVKPDNEDSKKLRKALRSY